MGCRTQTGALRSLGLKGRRRRILWLATSAQKSQGVQRTLSRSIHSGTVLRRQEQWPQALEKHWLLVGSQAAVAAEAETTTTMRREDQIQEARGDARRAKKLTQGAPGAGE